VKLLASCLLVIVAAFYGPSPSQGISKYFPTVTPDSALAVSALQTHMPTKQGNVPHLQPQEQSDTTSQPKLKLDPIKLHQEAQELLELSQSLQNDIDSMNRGLRPKDTIEKLKRIQKLAKHLRGEIGP
jgi:hypothetical protein